MNSTTDRALVAYVPVPHAGYLKFFRAYPGSVLYVLGDEFIQEFPSLVRHLPGAMPGEVQAMVRALGIFSDVRILTLANIAAVQRSHIVMPDEDVSRALAEQYFAESDIAFDGRWRLRWDWGSSQKKLDPGGRRVTCSEFEREMMGRTITIAGRSPDWWRQVGAMLSKDGTVLLAACNKHQPSEQSAYLYGDPRSNFEQGVGIEVSVSGHAEVLLLAEAARRGIKTEGCELYVNIFPCPPCAYPVSHSGIYRLYYAEGYSLLHAADALDARNIEIVRVDMTQPSP